MKLFTYTNKTLINIRAKIYLLDPTYSFKSYLSKTVAKYLSISCLQHKLL